MVYAQIATTAPANPLGTRFGTLGEIFGFIMNLVLGIGIVLTVVYLILGGIKYITSQGDQKNTQQAREWLTNAVIGFVVVIGAFVIRTVVFNALGGNSSALTISGVTPTE